MHDCFTFYFFEKVLLWKVITHTSLLAVIIFHNFLQFYSTLSEKMIFVTNFPFLMDSPEAPTPLMAKINAP